MDPRTAKFERLPEPHMFTAFLLPNMPRPGTLDDGDPNYDPECRTYDQDQRRLVKH